MNRSNHNVFTVIDWLRLVWRTAAASFLILPWATAERAAAGVNDIFEAVKQSEFRFLRTDSQVPFMPLAWLQDQYYPDSHFDSPSGSLPSATVVENTISQGLVAPVYVAPRDMFLLGEDLQWDHLDIRSGPYQDKDVLLVTPVAAWLHQFQNGDDLLGAFVAPTFSRELKGGDIWGTKGYAGIIGIHYQNDRVQWLYGGVYENNFGRSHFYPYAGVQWLPDPRVSLSLVFPWPTISYAPTDRILLQIALGPGGSSWQSRQNDTVTSQSFGSWNLSANFAYRLHGKLWLSTGAGLAGLRGVKIGDDRTNQLEAKPGPVFTLALQFRP